MSSITVRNLDESIKTGLRLRAASHGWSMEQEVRVILARAVQGESAATLSFVERVNQRFKGLDAGNLPAPSRQPARTAPTL
jgi:plasmid stability protein